MCGVRVEPCQLQGCAPSSPGLLAQTSLFQLPFYQFHPSVPGLVLGGRAGTQLTLSLWGRGGAARKSAGATEDQDHSCLLDSLQGDRREDADLRGGHPAVGVGAPGSPLGQRHGCVSASSPSLPSAPAGLPGTARAWAPGSHPGALSLASLLCLCWCVGCPGAGVLSPSDSAPSNT